MIRYLDNNYIGYIGGDTWILVFHILLKKGVTKHPFLKNALQILIIHGLMISNQSITIVGPHGYLKLLPD